MATQRHGHSRPDALTLSLQCLGSVAAIGSGTARPLMVVIFGGLVNMYNTRSPDPVGAGHAIDKQVLFLVAIFLAQWTATCAYGILFSVSAMRYSIRLRTAYLRALISQDAEQQNESRTAVDLSSNMAVVEDAFAEKAGTVLQALSTVITALVIAFTRSWHLSLPLLFMVLFLVASNLGTAALDARLELGIHAVEAQAAALAEECFGGIRVVTAFLATPKMERQYAAILDRVKIKGIRKSPVRAVQYSVSYLVVLSVYALGFWYGTRLLVKGKIANGGSVVIVILCINQATNAMRLLLPIYSLLSRAKAAHASLIAVIATEPRVDPFSTQGISLDESTDLEVEFQNMDFSYPSRQSVKALDRLSLKLQAGKVTAVVGPSGSGKSTLVALLERWHDPTCGSIKINNTPIESYNISSLRSKIRIVQQDARLFNDTVLNNISYGLAGTKLYNLPEAERRALVVKVCKEVHAHHFIQQLSHGYDTIVGARGALLSGGQRQRIAIARAIISNPPLLIFDEATSALDAESERLVKAAIDQVCVGRTTLIIAHKLGTVQAADTIAVLKDGKIVDQGPHKSLIQTCELYAKMWSIQSMSLGEVNGKTDKDVPQEETGTHLKSISLMEKVKVLSVEPADQPSTDSFKQTVKPTSLAQKIRMILKSSRNLKYVCVASMAACILAGAVYPIQAVIFGNNVTSYQKEGNQVTHSINFWSLMFFVLALASLISFFFVGTLSSIAGRLTVQKYRDTYFNALIRQPTGFYDDHKNTPGLLTASLSTHPGHLESFVTTLSTLIITVVNLCSVIILGFIVSWRFSVVATFGALPVIVLGGYLRVKVATSKIKKLTGPLMDSAQYAAEIAENIRTVSAFTMEEQVCRIMAEKMACSWPGFYRAVSLEMPLFAFAHTGSLLGMALSFWYAGHLLIDGKITALQLWIVFLGVVSGAEAAGEFFANADSIFHAKTSSAAIVDAVSTATNSPNTDEENEKLLSGAIEFVGVGFSYPTNPSKQVLKEINLKAPAGSTIAIVGPSGSGKSTLMSLLERAHTPTEGTITIGTRDLSKTNLHHYRSSVSLVSQDTHLFNGTIRENILLGVPDVELDSPNSASTVPELEAALIHAAQAANIHTFITSLPEGYDTPCGKKATLFSGGQRQRLALARALVRQPTILLLDEATSALDSESELHVKRALANAAEGRTTIAVAHRLSTVRDADAIYVLEQGRVVEWGTHGELVAGRGLYWRMVQAQSEEVG